MTVGAARAAVMEQIHDAETVYALPVLDGGRLAGVVGLRRLLGTDAAEPVTGVMRDAVTVEAHVPAEDAARLCAAEQLVALPVVDGTGGSTGNQAATTVTRALALGDMVVRDVVVRDVGRVGFREVWVRTLLAARLGAAGLLGVGAVYGWAVGAVIGLTLLVVSVLAVTVGGLIPVMARVLEVHPPCSPTRSSRPSWTPRA